VRVSASGSATSGPAPVLQPPVGVVDDDRDRQHHQTDHGVDVPGTHPIGQF
jgi:hypothetical protein